MFGDDLIEPGLKALAQFLGGSGSRSRRISSQQRERKRDVEDRNQQWQDDRGSPGSSHTRLFALRRSVLDAQKESICRYWLRRASICGRPIFRMRSRLNASTLKLATTTP